MGKVLAGAVLLFRIPQALRGEQECEGVRLGAGPEAGGPSLCYWAPSPDPGQLHLLVDLYVLRGKEPPTGKPEAMPEYHPIHRV